MGGFLTEAAPCWLLFANEPFSTRIMFLPQPICVFDASLSA